jgi:hypothetical protein
MRLAENHGVARDEFLRHYHFTSATTVFFSSE